MVFTMPVCSIARSFYRYLLLAIIFWSPVVAASTFKIDSAKIEQIGNGYTLHAEISYPLTPRVLEALHNGVPITFFQELELIHAIPLLGDLWQWESTLWQSELKYELHFHALTLQYVLRSVDTHYQQSFPTLHDALRALGHVEKLTLPPKHTADTDNLVLKIRSGLDLNALPTPMRPGALVSRKWQLTSPWVEATWP